MYSRVDVVQPLVHRIMVPIEPQRERMVVHNMDMEQPLNAFK